MSRRGAAAPGSPFQPSQPARLLVEAGRSGATLVGYTGMLDELRITRAVEVPNVVELDLWRSPC